MGRMTFWQENYTFIKDVYDMRHQKMAEWMENVEKAIARIMADKVYTSAEFKRERDNFQALCKDLERTEVKKWLNQILEILMAERAKSQQETENEKLSVLIKKHEELIPSVQKTSVMVDLYWKCYAYEDELKRITDYVTKLAADTKIECDKYSNDVKYWAEYRTGIKEYSPWLAGAEKATAEGLAKPSDLNEVKALHEKVYTFDKTCLTYAKVLDAANGAAQKMTTHAEADAEVAALKERYNKVKAVSDEWVKKVDVLLKEWTLLDNTVTDLNSWVAKDKSSEGENQFSLEKMESTLGELKNIFKEKEKLVENL